MNYGQMKATPKNELVKYAENIREEIGIMQVEISELRTKLASNYFTGYAADLEDAVYNLSENCNDAHMLLEEIENEIASR